MALTGEELTYKTDVTSPLQLGCVVQGDNTSCCNTPDTQPHVLIYLTPDKKHARSGRCCVVLTYFLSLGI